MNQYHLDADPQFVAMRSHYEDLPGNLMYALFISVSVISPTLIPLDSELHEFCDRLWAEGFKIIPINELPATTNTYSGTDRHS